MMVRAITAQDKRWRAEDDARTLAQSEEIRLDKKRLKSATDAAKRMVEEDKKRALAMQKVANRSTPATKKENPVKKKKSSSSKNNTFKRI